VSDPQDIYGQWCEPLDWTEFLSDGQDDSANTWDIEPIAPRGSHVGIYAKQGTGKSLLLLDGCAGLASGRPVFGVDPVPAVNVIYVDMENPASDVRDRMLDFGYTADSDLKHFHYFHMSTLPPLDSEEGGLVLGGLVERFSARLVVVDTMASTLAGGENEADTYRRFHQYAGRRLRAAEVGLIRLDNPGKNATRGQRGSSAKLDNLDLVWEMTESKGGTLVLSRGKHRVPWVPPVVRLHREEQPVLRHVLVPEPLPEGTLDVADLLDELKVPLTASIREALTALRAARQGRRQDVVTAALKYRRRPR
jgi:hypothetical protein